MPYRTPSGHKLVMEVLIEGRLSMAYLISVQGELTHPAANGSECEIGSLHAHLLGLFAFSLINVAAGCTRDHPPLPRPN